MSITPILSLPQVAPNQEQKEATINTALAILEAGFNDAQTYDLSAADIALTAQDFTRWFYHKFTGGVVVRTVTIPQTPRWFAVRNDGSAAITITTNNAGQTFSLPAGKRALLVSDGTDVDAIVPDPTGGVGVIGDLSDVDPAAPASGQVMGWDGTIWKPTTLNIAFNFLDLTDTPASFSGAGGMLLAVNAAGDGIEFVTSAANVNDFLDLTDTPTSYTGQGGRYARVNSSGNALIFSDLRLTHAADFPSSYAGAGGRFVTVNAGANGLEFSEAAFLSLSDTPADYTGSENRYLKVKADGTGIEFAAGTSGPDEFIELLDTPNVYEAGKLIRNNDAGNGIVYGAGFTHLDDTPSDFAGAANRAVFVNGAANGLEFRTLNFLSLEDTPATFTANAWLRVNPTGNGLIYSTPTFLGLGDTPSAFVGNEGAYLRVKLDGSGLQFVASPTFTTNFLALSDTPGAYGGQAGRVVVVNGAENGLGFVDYAGDFLSLTDTPSTYANKAGYSVRVNAAGSGIEFVQDNTAASFVIPQDFGPQRHWRLRFTAIDNVAAGPIRIDEVELRGTPGGNDLALSGGGTASSTDGANIAFYAFDNDLATYWMSSGNVGGGATERLAYDFGSGAEQMITEVAVTARGTNAPAAFDIQYSTDGVTWQTAWSVAGETAWIGSGETRVFTAPTTTGVALRTLEDGPTSYINQGGLVVRIRQDETGFEYSQLPVTALAGVPAFATNQNKGLRITAAGDALEAYDIISSFLGLSGTPTTFAGAGGYRVKVNAGASALEFVQDTLGNLSDTDFSSAPVNGNVLLYDGGLGRWRPGSGGSGGATALNDLSDVDLSTTPPATGDFLTLNAGGSWVPTQLALSTSDLIDVSAAEPLDGQGLLWDSLTSQYVPAEVNFIFDLGDLLNVNLTGGADGDFLRFNNATSEWVSATFTLTMVSDVDLSTPPTDGQVLAFVAAAGVWRPTTVSGGSGSGATSLDGLSDVDTTTSAPLDREVLEFNAASSTWVPAARGTVYTRTGDLAIVNGNFGDAVNLAGWTITKGSPAAMVAASLSPISGQTKYLYHANSDAQDYEVEQVVALAFPGYPGTVTIGRHCAATFSPVEDIPYLEVGFRDSSNVLIGAFERRLYAPGSTNTWFFVSEEFTCPSNAVDMVIRVGGQFGAGSIVNAATDIVTASYVKFVTDMFDLIAALPSLTGNAGSVLGVNAAENGVEWVAGGGGGGSGTFLGLSDTPALYSGASGLVVRVNGAGNGLEFAAFNLAALSDVSQSKTGNGGKVLAVNSAEDGHEYVDRNADVGFFIQGRPADGELCAIFAVSKPFTVASSGSQGTAEVAAAASATFSLRKNGAQFGTATFNAGASTASFSVTQTSFVAGDRIQVVAPGTADTNLSDIALTLAGAR